MDGAREMARWPSTGTSRPKVDTPQPRPRCRLAPLPGRHRTSTRPEVTSVDDGWLTAPPVAYPRNSSPPRHRTAWTSPSSDEMEALKAQVLAEDGTKPKASTHSGGARKIQ